jgi:hypothetical protein
MLLINEKKKHEVFGIGISSFFSCEYKEILLLFKTEMHYFPGIDVDSGLGFYYLFSPNNNWAVQQKERQEIRCCVFPGQKIGHWKCISMSLANPCNVFTTMFIENMVHHTTVRP